MGKSVLYLCLQATSEGQASYAHVHEIVNGLKRRGWTVELFEPFFARTSTSPGALVRLVSFVWVQLLLSTKLNRYRIVYIRSHFAALPTSILCKLMRIPVVQEVNGPYEDLFIAWPRTRLFGRVFKWMIRFQLRWAAAVVTVTPQLKEWVIQETGQQSIYVIPNGANTQIFHPNASSRFSIEGSYAVFFGALAAWQGIETILMAINSPEWPQDVKLVIIGDGAERAIVEKAARNSTKVVYLGKIPYQDVAGVVANSLVGLSPNNNRGGRSQTGLFPLKVFETLACGVPVIVTDFPGQADLVKEHNCGIVVSPDDPAALAEAVSFFYSNPSARHAMGQRGREVVEKEHSWDQRAGVTENMLIELMKGVGKR
ncbi:MAG: glycosyltransferase family 4 protein [Bacillota bacterium]